MSLLKGFSAIVMSGLLGAASGGGIGYGIGRFLPGVYRGTFFGGQDPEFNPIHVGIALGGIQGLSAGLVIGVIVVTLVTWYETRKG